MARTEDRLRIFLTKVQAGPKVTPTPGRGGGGGARAGTGARLRRWARSRAIGGNRVELLNLAPT